MKSTSAAVAAGNLLEIALDEGNLNTFVQAIQASGLADMLASEGPYTIFAPNDAAFNQFEKKTVNELLQNKEELVTLLSYHIVPGKFMESDLRGRSSLQSELGKAIPIESSGQGLWIGPADIVEPDIECGNGVIHVIDSVLVPE